MTSTTIDNSADMIDSRDIIARIAELEADEDRDQDEQDELVALTELADEAEDYVEDWQYGATLVRHSYFVEYAQQLADDIGAVSADAGWPNGFIDWDRAADELLMDYHELKFGEVTYYAR